MTSAVAGATADRLGLGARFAYGLLGLPLAMAALPLYVHLPKFYGDHLGVSLTALGFVLLALRLADGFIDPLLGAWSDRAPSRKRLIGFAMPVLVAGIAVLFLPAGRSEAALLAWMGVALALVYTAFSLATINHNAWGAELSQDPVGRTRITAMREGLALVGVVVASLAPGWLGGAGGESAGAIGRMSQKERFRWLTAPRSTIVQTSPAHAGRCDDPAALLEHLLATMVRAAKPEARATPQKERGDTV